MKTISVFFRCGCVEKLTEAEIRKQEVECPPPFKINDNWRSFSGQYCLECSKPKPANR